jgi:hypothetical protein
VSMSAVAALLALMGALAFAGLDAALAAAVALTACEVGVVVVMGILTARTIAQESSWQLDRGRQP